MNAAEATDIAETVLQAYRQMRYDDLARMVDETVWVRKFGATGAVYNVQVQAFWDAQPRGNVRVLAAVDDGKSGRVMCPLTCDFIIAPSGEFVGE
jgi:hypothetical protein